MTKVDPRNPEDRGWIAVDLDGTLAEHTGWTQWNKFGRPIPAMVDRVRGWLEDGREVRIFTARVSEGVSHCLVTGERITAEMMTKAIHDWLVEAGLPPLECTCRKDHRMVELWDDRCVQVIPNTGQTIAPWRPYLTEEQCPGHVASDHDKKVCGRCGVHIDSFRPEDDQP